MLKVLKKSQFAKLLCQLRPCKPILKTEDLQGLNVSLPETRRPSSPWLQLSTTGLRSLEGGPLRAHDQFLPGQCPGGLRPQPSQPESRPTWDSFSLSSRFANMDDRSLVFCGQLSLPHFREEKAAWRRSRKVATLEGAGPQLCWGQIAWAKCWYHR